MLDEEAGFWDPTNPLCGPGAPTSAAAYEDINSGVAALMGSSLVRPGSFWYTENFTKPVVLKADGTTDPTGRWDQRQFEAIGGSSIPAPQIANDLMVNRANADLADTGRASMLVTWSLNGDFQFQSLYGAEFRIAGAPYNEFGFNLSNCFTTGAEVCNDWDGDGVVNSADNCISVANQNQTNTDGNNRALNRGGQDALGDACDDDIDGDGWSNEQETCIGRDPNVYCKIMRADVNDDGKVNLLDQSVIASHFNQTIPPADPRIDQNSDAKINLLDLSAISSVFNETVAACP